MTAPAPSWLSAFDADDKASFFAEMRWALDRAEEAGCADAIEACLGAWRRTAEALADPQVRAVLTAPPGADDDFAEAARPGLTHN